MKPDKPLHKMGEEELEDWIESLSSTMRVKQVACVSAFVSGKGQREAYWSAYGEGDQVPPERINSIDVNAHRLLSQPKCIALADAIRHRNSRAESIDLGTVIRAQLDIARRARAAEDFTNERQAMAEVSKLLDLYPSEKREVLLKGEGLADLTPEEWQAVFAAQQEHTIQ